MRPTNVLVILKADDPTDLSDVPARTIGFADVIVVVNPHDDSAVVVKDRTSTKAHPAWVVNLTNER